MRPIHRIACLLILSSLGGGLFAQTTSGTISGFVEDPTHSVIKGADVSLTNEGTNVSLSTISKHAGDFVFPDLQAGFYTVTVTAPGFKELRKVHLTLDAAHNISTGRLTLQPGEPRKRSL